MLTRILVLVLLAAVAVIFGCSTGGSNDITTPGDELPGALRDADSSNTHLLAGFYQFTADPEAGTLDAVPLRSAGMHFNALAWVEPAPFIFLTVDNLEFNGNMVDVDIGLRHPWLGDMRFMGFDVCGILITNGSVSGFTDPDLRMAGPGDVRLLNPDGYSRWWNPAEFPINECSMFCYKDGLLGTPYECAHYNSTINGYKFFCDDLDKDDPLTEVSVEGRAKFLPNKKNIRHYTIEHGDEGFIFNYAIDACWSAPDDDLPPPYDVDNFPPQANRTEAYNITVTELENTLFYNDATGHAGGVLNLMIDVWDHFELDFNQVHAESLAGIPLTSTLTPISGGEGYNRYELELSGDELTQYGDAEMLIIVQSEESGYQGLLPGKPVCAYFTQAFNIREDAADLCELADTPCAKLGYDKYNRGRSPHTGPTTPPIVEWELGSDGNFVIPPVILPNGLIFYGTYEPPQFRAVDLSGDIQWHIDVDDTPQAFPIVRDDGTIYVTTGFADADIPGTAYSLSQDGQENWTKTIAGGCWGWQTSLDDEACIFYVGSRAGIVYALDGDTGDELWTFGLGVEDTIRFSPTIADDGTIYFGSHKSHAVWAVNPDSTEKWKYDLGDGWMSYAPSIDESGDLYFGGKDKFWALHPDGTWKWDTDIGYWNGVAAIGLDGSIISNSFDGLLYSLAPNDGSVNWTIPGVGNWGIPVVDNQGLIFVGFANIAGGGGALKAFSNDGAQLWEVALAGACSHVIILPDGKLVISSGGSLYLLS